jgi:hypothetical protein
MLSNGQRVIDLVSDREPREPLSQQRTLLPAPVG